MHSGEFGSCFSLIIPPWDVQKDALSPLPFPWKCQIGVNRLGDFSVASSLLRLNMCCFCENNVVVFSGIIWYKASLASAQRAQQLKASCQESRVGKVVYILNALWIEQQILWVAYAKPKWTHFFSFQPSSCVIWTKSIQRVITHCCLFGFWQRQWRTRRLSPLPSQCLLASASNPLHLSLVHGAG